MLCGAARKLRPMQAEVLALGSLTRSSAPVHVFLVCEPSALGRALLADMECAVGVTHAATREDFAPAIMVRDARRQLDPGALAKAEEEMRSEGRVALALRPRAEAIDVLRAWEKKNADLGGYSIPLQISSMSKYRFKIPEFHIFVVQGDEV